MISREIDDLSLFPKFSPCNTIYILCTKVHFGIYYVNFSQFLQVNLLQFGTYVRAVGGEESVFFLENVIIFRIFPGKTCFSRGFWKCLRLLNFQCNLCFSVWAVPPLQCLEWVITCWDQNESREKKLVYLFLI